MLKLYQITFDVDSYEIEILYDLLDDNIKDEIYNLDVLASFDFDEGENYKCFLLAEEDIINNYLNILKLNNISYICKDITKDVINNDFNIEEYVKQRMDLLEHINFYIFNQEINTWIYENLDIDNILDRINKDGIESLREIDLQFLNDSK